MARSRKRSSTFSNAGKYRRKTIGGNTISTCESSTVNSSVLKENSDHPSTSSSADTDKLCLRLSSSTNSTNYSADSGNITENGSVLKKADSSCEITEVLDSSSLINATTNSNNLCKSRIADSSVWSIHTSEVDKLSSLENTTNKSQRSFAKNKRRTLGVVGEKMCNISEVVGSPVNGTPNSGCNDLDLPPTQRSGPLTGVNAYIEIFNGSLDNSRYIANVIRDLGATVCQRFNTKVTHVIFRDGLRSTIEKARTRKIPCVSILWIECCIKENSLVSVDEFKVSDKDQFGRPMVVGRLKKPRYVQSAAEFDIKEILSDEKVKKRVKRLENYRLMKEIRQFKVTETPEAENVANRQDTVLVQDTPVECATAAEQYSDSNWKFLTETCTPDSLRAQLDELKTKVAEILGTPDSGDEFEEDSLALKVKRKLFEPGGLLYGTPPPSFLDAGTSHAVAESCVGVPVTPKTKTIFSHFKTTENSSESENNFIKRRLIVRDSVENVDNRVESERNFEDIVVNSENNNEHQLSPMSSAGGNKDGTRSMDEIVEKTQSMELKSPVPSRSPRKHSRSVTPDKTRDFLDNFKNNVDEVAYNVEIGDNVQSRTVNMDVCEPANLKQMRSPSNLSADSSSVSVGPIVLMQRKVSCDKQNNFSLDAAVNTRPTFFDCKGTFVGSVPFALKPSNGQRSPVQAKPINEHCYPKSVLPCEKMQNQQQPPSISNPSAAVGEKIPPISPSNCENSSLSQNSSIYNLSKNVLQSPVPKNVKDIGFKPAAKTVETATNCINSETLLKTQKRFRSSLFYVKTPFESVNELQKGRPSPEEFLSSKSKTTVVSLVDKKKSSPHYCRSQQAQSQHQTNWVQ